MLRLERARRGPSITIRLREKDKTFDRKFLKALAIAGALHLGAILTFSVARPCDDSGLVVLKPSNVQIDLGSSNRDYLCASLPEHAGGDISNPSMHYIIEPHPPTPLLPDAPTSTIERPINTSGSECFALEPFRKLETLSYEPDAIALPFHDQRPPVTVNIGGALAGSTVIDDGTLVLEGLKAPKKTTEQVVISYTVKADDKSGYIFYYETEHPYGVSGRDQQLRQLAETLLTTMRFQPQTACKTAFVTDGRIEFVFEVDEQSEETAWNQALTTLLKRSDGESI